MGKGSLKLGGRTSADSLVLAVSSLRLGLGGSCTEQLALGHALSGAPASGDIW